MWLLILRLVVLIIFLGWLLVYRRGGVKASRSMADGLTEQGVPFFWPFNDDRKYTLPDWARGMGRGLLSLAAIIGILGLIVLRLRPFFA